MPTSARSAAALVAALLVGLVVSAAAQAAPGDLDPTFSGDGMQTTDFGGGDLASGVVLQGDGKIVAVGQSGAGGYDFAVARYNPNGLLDTSFSGDGKQTTDFGGEFGIDVATAVALAPDGKIVAVGRGPGEDFALARYRPNGSLDPTFSGDGKQTTNFGSGDEATAVKVQSNGKIVVAGYSGGSFALARYKPNGSLDPIFSGDGKLTTSFGQFSDVASGVAIQPDGKIVAVGSAGTNNGQNFALARYKPNGSLDPTFSGDGKQTTSFGTFDTANAMVIQPDGKIVAAGGALDGDFGLARYNPNGSLDPTFSGDGKQTTDFGGSQDGASGVALQGDGKIVAAGCACPNDNFARDFALARYTPNGSLDPTFSGDGKQTTDFGASQDIAFAVALQTDGKIVAVGRGGPGVDFALARYLGG
jgi:uncharacterized delta-60 repeat protein